MSTLPKTIITIALSGLLGAAITIGVYSNRPNSIAESTKNSNSEPDILYWVAPMDANYRRDKPGQSPMGMDLIPVYKESSSSDNTEPGIIKISPEVVNNLGVRTSKAEYKTLNTQIKTVGYVQYDEDRLVHIHPRVEGWVDKLYVKAAGNPIENGQPLYDLYSPQLVNAQQELVLVLNRNNKRLIEASEERLRALQLTSAFIQKLKKTKKIQQTVTFYAPQSGVVDNLNIREGFYVQPGTTLMSIGQLDEVWVEAEIYERQTSLVAAGQQVTMTMDYLPREIWQGTVDYVYPTLDEKTRTARVRLRFANPNEHLKPNMFAQVIIHAPPSSKYLVVPNEAVIRTGSQNRVVVALGDGHYKSISIELGRSDTVNSEIIDGLTAGDLVVTSAQFLLDSESSKTSDFKRMHHETESDITPTNTEHNSMNHESVNHETGDHNQHHNMSQEPNND